MLDRDINPPSWPHDRGQCQHSHCQKLIRDDIESDFCEDHQPKCFFCGTEDDLNDEYICAKCYSEPQREAS